MNYLAHAYRFLDDPYFVAGTALPDWMSVIDRKNRARRRFAEPVTEDCDPQIAALAKGCVQHHDDDDWFHRSDAFVEMSTRFAVELRTLLATGLGHQAGFVGHIAVELLLDSVLVARHPGILDDYYSSLASLNREKLQEAANKICPRPVTRLTALLPRFIEERFLADYQDDERLRMRLNGVMRRVGLPMLPPPVTDWLGSARLRVHTAADRLLRPSG